MTQRSKLGSGRVLTTQPNNVRSDRYTWLGLDSAEPNLGTSGNGYVLTSNISGSRIWTNNLSIANVTANTITANYFYGNGAFLTGLPPTYSNVDVSNFLQQYTGNITAGNIVANSALINGNITSTYFFGDGSNLTGVITTGTGNIKFANTTITSNTDITLQTLTNGNIYLIAGNTGIVQITGTDAVGIPAGDDAGRPANPEIGYFRFNTQRNTIEYWDGNSWDAPSAATISSETIAPDGVSNVYTLGSNVTVDGILVSINGTLQQPLYSYDIVNNNQIRFTEIPLTSDAIEIRFIGSSMTSVSSLRYSTSTSIVLDAGNINITGDTVVAGTLNVTGNIILNGSINNKPNVIIPNIATTTIDSYSTSAWRTVKYIIQAVRNSDVESYETLVTHNRTLAASTTYGHLTLGNTLGNVSATIVGSNVEVQYTTNFANTYLTVSRDFYPL